MLVQSDPKKVIFRFSLLFFLSSLFFLFNCSGKKAKCETQKDCKKGYYCSQEGHCQRAVSCKKTRNRLKACAEAFLEEVVVGYRQLSPRKRNKLSTDLKKILPKKIYLSCLDTRVEAKQTKGKSSSAKDVLEEGWKKCMQKDACDDFAKCALKLAKYRYPEKTKYQ